MSAVPLIVQLYVFFHNAKLLKKYEILCKFAAVMKFNRNNIMTGLRVFVFILACGIGYAIWLGTLVEWWVPLVSALVIGAIIMPLIIHFMRQRQWLDIIFRWIEISAWCYCLIMAANLAFADKATLHKETAVVENIYQKKNYRYRRRHVSTPYYTYHIQVKFETGAVKEFSIPVDRYRHMRKGRKLTYEVRRGFFGWPLVR